MKMIFSFLLLLISFSFGAAKTCNVLDYGGKADNKTDLGPAVISAYKYVFIVFLFSIFTSFNFL